MRTWALDKLGFLPAAAFWCMGCQPQQQTEREVQLEVPVDSPFKWGARIRASAAGTGTRPEVGVVGGVGDCLVFLVPVDQGFMVVNLNDVRHVEVSSLFDGHEDADGEPRVYRPGADTSGESWTVVDPGLVKDIYGGCVY